MGTLHGVMHVSHTEERRSEQGDTENSLQQRTDRLHTVVEMGVIGESPLDQARRVLQDSIAALHFDYGEFGESSAAAEAYVPLCVVGEGCDAIEHGVGRHGIDRDKPFIVFDTLEEGYDDEAVTQLGLRSMLFWPFTAEGKRCVLCFGWKKLLDEFIS